MITIARANFHLKLPSQKLSKSQSDNSEESSQGRHPQFYKKIEAWNVYCFKSPIHIFKSQVLFLEVRGFLSFPYLKIFLRN